MESNSSCETTHMRNRMSVWISLHLDSLVELMGLTESNVRFAGMVAVIYLTTLDEQEVAVLLLLHHLYRHRRHFSQRRLQALVGVQVVLQVFRAKQTCTETELVKYLQELLDLKDYLSNKSHDSGWKSYVKKGYIKWILSIDLC